MIFRVQRRYVADAAQVRVCGLPSGRGIPSLPPNGGINLSGGRADAILNPIPRRLQLFSALVFLGLGLIVWWAMSQAAEKRLNPNKRDWESFVARQVAEQTAERPYLCGER